MPVALFFRDSLEPTSQPVTAPVHRSRPTRIDRKWMTDPVSMPLSSDAIHNTAFATSSGSSKRSERQQSRLFINKVRVARFRLLNLAFVI